MTFLGINNSIVTGVLGIIIVGTIGLLIDALLFHSKRKIVYQITQLRFEHGEKTGPMVDDSESLATNMTILYKKMSFRLQLQAGTIDQVALILAAPNTKFELDAATCNDIIPTELELIDNGTCFRGPVYRVTADFDLLVDEPINYQLFYVITQGLGAARLDYLVAKLDLHCYIHTKSFIANDGGVAQRVLVSEWEPIINYRFLTSGQTPQLKALTYPDGGGLNVSLRILRKDTRLIQTILYPQQFIG
ncbi:hypothetical protein EQG49_01115 [Periweissella cryptocerci]|uniref:Uncharacterized protein n=1 Tax=Periweissella cryptocerci TaxID=2506420 RepID=A0A4P6YRA3_9LACO|nr:hypothetical protein [Periweissella cryptocerci]QBO35150.1 hypothetical protein EQG49_01115 [Periweissella cryptocerci]